jgi:hypothetical protein
MGWVRANASLPMPATFREGLLPTLRTFCTWYAPGKPGAVPLVMRLTGLEIAEKPGTIETAAAGLTADFYAPQPDSTYRLVAHFAQTREQSSGFVFADVTGRHAANLGELLRSAVAQACDQTHWFTNGPSYPAAYVLASEAASSEILPVLAPNVQPRAGFYYSIAEFWHNQPARAELPFIESRPYLGTEWAGAQRIKPYHTTAIGQHELATDVWGFSDGKECYVRMGTDFYPLKRQGSGFIFYGIAGTSPVVHSAVNVVAIATIASGNGGVISIDPEHRVLYRLSLLTGVVSIDQPTGMDSPTPAVRPTQLFVYRPRSAKGPAVRIRLGEEQTTQELAAGQFLSFSPRSDLPLQVYVVPETGPETSFTVTPTTEAPTYLEYLPKLEHLLHQVADKVGASALNKMAGE